MVLPRVLTALILIPLILAAVWFGTLPFFILVLGISMLAAWEYSVIAEHGGYPNDWLLTLIGTFLLVVGIYIDGVPQGPIKETPSVIFVFICWVFIVCIREFFSSNKSHSHLRIVTTVSGVLFCGFLLGHLVLIRDIKLVQGDGFVPVGRHIAFFLIFVIWSVDTGAWAVGRLFGRHKLARSISPNKTWEGTFGGLLLGMFVGWFYAQIFLKEGFRAMEALLFALAIGVMAQISDLIESQMKRSFGVKDSSHILPGHGGILDRFDAFIFTAPIFYYLLLGTSRFH